MTEIRSIALVALGGNLPSDAGEPETTLCLALGALADQGVVIRAVSRFFTTPCFPAGAGPDYVNAVIRVETVGEAEELLSLLHRIEHRFGRARVQRWGMRTLDLDLLAMDQRVLPDETGQRHWRDLPAQDQRELAPEQLILPHPRLQDRAFVLVPLCDVAPDWRHPVLGITARDMCSALPEQDLEAVSPL